ncbi:hypothetical protein QZH41_010434, partial [Actinostola sp. cb2023]
SAFSNWNTYYPQWLNKRTATKSALQSLLGKLVFVSKCVRQSRVFISRILDLLRRLGRNHHHINLNADFRKDIQWWCRFLRQYNGVSIINTAQWSSPGEVFATDAFLVVVDFLTVFIALYIVRSYFRFILMARLANIVPSSRFAFNYKRHLTRGDVAFADTGLLVTFKCTKTIQFGERLLQIPLLRIHGSPLCPVAAYSRMVQFLPANCRSAVFIMPFLGSYIPLTKRALVSSFRKHLAIAGVELSHSYRGHSFRRGAASWAFSIGIPGEIIQIYGDWTSDAYKRYLEFSFQSK